VEQKRDVQAWDKINRDLRQSQSAKSLSEGGLPVEAVERLTNIVADKRRTFSANLSVNEFLCTRAAGHAPIAQVSGSSMFHLGWQTLPFFNAGELQVITEAQASLRRLAVARIQQEARLLKADGVIGVKLDNHEYDWGQGLLQFTLVGTAIKMPQHEVNPNPFVSTLTGQEFWSLYEAGFAPVGFAYGNSVFYQTATEQSRYVLGEEQQFDWQQRGTGWFNQEVVDFTEAIDSAKTLAEMRLQEDLLNLGASGIIDVKFDRKIRFYERSPVLDKKRTDMSVSVEITGTAISLRHDHPMPSIDYSTWLSQ
jgi:uncharacterized protein YbjQ (UPF0145 family)